MDPQEDDEVKFAFQEWKKKWNIEYATLDEEKTRFENFGKNYLSELEQYPPAEPLWTVLNHYANLPIDSHFGYIRLDDELESDDEDEDATFWVDFPVKQEDGTHLVLMACLNLSKRRCNATVIKKNMILKRRIRMLLSNTKVPCYLPNALVIMTKMIPKRRTRINARK